MAQAQKIGDAAVKQATGYDWKHWFGVLDRAGGKAMDHKEHVAWLGSHSDMSDWWHQMVAVTYEQDRGLRKRHQQATGFQISRSRTLAVPLSQLYFSWKDPSARRRWLGERIKVRKATTNKSLRITWSDEKSSLDVYFYGRGRGKSQVTVNHGKLPSAREATRMKAYWGEALDRLQREVSKA